MQLHQHVLEQTGVTFEPHRLTIGFARRFATYKRANLVFSDLEALQKIGSGKIQFVFSGKAHPKDMGGKALIKDIFKSSKSLSQHIPVAFLEDYSMDTGLLMTSGVDIWLNNPTRPMEASGTSGMKAAMNGTPNCSILDGWWPEACIHGVNGWAIGNGESHGTNVIGNDAKGDSLGAVVFGIRLAACLGDGVEQWRENVCVVVGFDPLHRHREALKTHSRVDVLVGEWDERSVCHPIEFHEYQIPDFHHLRMVVIHQFFSGNPRNFIFCSQVYVNFRARTTWACIAHFPEVIFLVSVQNARLIDIASPEIKGLLIKL